MLREQLSVMEQESVVMTVRNIIFIAECDDGSGDYRYRVFNTKGESVCPPGIVKAKSVPYLQMVFRTALCNYRVVDGKITIGWSEKLMDAIDEMLVNLYDERHPSEPGDDDCYYVADWFDDDLNRVFAP